MADNNKPSDYKLPPVSSSPTPVPNIPPATSTFPGPVPSNAGGQTLPSSPLPRPSISPTEWGIAIGAVIVMAVLFWVARRALVGFLTDRHADYVRAKSAGNMLFLLLLTLGVAVTAGFLGNLWSSVLFFVSAGLLAFLFMVLFVVTLRSAQSRR